MMNVAMRAGGVEVLSGGLLVPHGFSTRAGGVSPAPFASLNFGNPGDLAVERRDSPENIGANWALLLAAIGAEGREVVQVHQVHGDVVHVVRRGDKAHASDETTKADAIVTDDPERVIAVRVADCCPVLFAGVDGRVVGAAHAGWRGVVSGVAVRTVEAMRAVMGKEGACAIHAVVGPCISYERFEVGPEVAAEFERAFGSGGFMRPSPGHEAAGKVSVDLKECLRRQLVEAGVERVEVLPHCTVAEPGLFYSHRRDAGVTGRMVGVVGSRG